MPDIRYVCLSDLHLGADNSILTAIKCTFYSQINASVNNAHDPWKTFSEVVAEAVGVHVQLLQTKIIM